jgi:hypothetical protein
MAFNPQPKKGMPPKKEKKPLNQVHKNIGKNMDFYKKAWDSKPKKVCEECGVALPEFNPIHISHIVPKSILPKFSNDLRNFFLLCAPCHYQVDFGDRDAMNITPQADIIKEILFKEYYENTDQN